MKDIFSYLLLGGLLTSVTITAQDTLWLHNADRFSEHTIIDMTRFDSIVFKKSSMYFYFKPDSIQTVDHITRTYTKNYDSYNQH